jgi:hypothetical protein
VAGKKKRKPVWRKGQTVWVFDPKLECWMTATVDRDVYAGEGQCVLNYFNDDPDLDYVSAVKIGVSYSRWGEYIRPLHEQPDATKR